MKRFFSFTFCIIFFTGCLATLDQPNPTQDNPAGFNSNDTQPVAAGDDRAEFLRIHNQARASVGAQSLEWSQELADFAQEWADKLASEDRMHHRSGHSYGENLAYGTNLDAAGGAQMWLGERAAYDGSAISNSNFSSIGHYTQMIWGSTTQVGYGIARNGRNTYVVANYSPAGNMIGEKP